jgi:hypothetical protein
MFTFIHEGDMKHFSYFCLIFASFYLLGFSISSSQIPQEISFQGVLRNAYGSFVNDGTFDIRFSIYNQESGGSYLWSESQTVSVQNGVFSVVLGTIENLDIDFNQQLWIEIDVEGEGELESRIKLTTSPYAIFAKTIADNSVNSSKIEDHSIGSVELLQPCNSMKW